MKHSLILILVLSLIGLAPCLADASKPIVEDSGPSINWERSTGGPDTFGYTWMDSDEVGGPTYSWIDITATGTEIATSDELGDDDRTGPYPIDFLFPFYGFAEELFWVQSNGMISFNGILYSGSNQALPYGFGGPLIAWFWDDLDPGDGSWGSVYYETRTIAMQDVCIITFDDYAEYPGGPTQDRITAQVLLYDDGLIRIQYQSIDAGFDCTSCTIGMQNHDGSDGLTYVHNDATGEYPNNLLVVDFVPPDPTSSLSGIVYQSGGGTIANANVRVGCGQTTSDAAGNYTINGVYPGTYPYIVWKTGYDAINTVTTLAVGGNTLHATLSLSPTPIVGSFTDNFEGGGTPLFTGSGEWEFGTPTYDPVGAHSGSNAWSTDLDGDYEVNQDDWLKSQKGFNVQVGYSLKYFHWYDYDGGSDGYNVWVSTDAGAFWTMIDPTGGYDDPDGFYTANGLPCFNNWGSNERMWVEVEFPLDDYAGQTVWFAYRHTSDPSVVYSGVTIDDFDYGSGGVAPTIILTLWPLITSVPSTGGVIMYDAGVTSTYSSVVSRQVWKEALLPNGVMFPISNQNVLIPPWTIFIGNMTENVPAFAPPGNYVFYAHIGSFPGNPETTDSFPFVKTIVPGPNGPVANWESSEWIIAEEETGQFVEIPDEFTLCAVWPNPFNASATVTVELPEASELSVRVFSLEGREVAVLNQGYTPAGIHNLHFDGEGLATGIYFVQATAGDNQSVVRKVTLLK